MQKLLSAYILLFSILFYACNSGDYNIDCGNDYIFMFEGGGLNKIGKELKRNDHSISYNLVIPHAVIDYAYNERYIIAVQVSDSATFTNSIDENKYLRDTSNHLYWIIESKEDIVHGPLSKHEYQKQRIELNVPLELKVGEGEFKLLREW